MTVVPAPKNDDFVFKLKEQKIKGYDEVESERGAALFSLDKVAKKEVNAFRFEKNPEDSHLKENISDIKLAYEVKPLAFINKKNLFGYAPVGMYKNDQGWTGITTFFKDQSLGVCAYTMNNIQISKEAIQLFEEFVRHDINHMPNVLSVEGTQKTGFLYKIHWFNEVFEKKLECANKNVYKKEITNKLIELARVIERTQVNS